MNMILGVILRNLVFLSTLLVLVANASESEPTELNNVSSDSVTLKPLGGVRKESSGNELIEPVVDKVGDSRVIKSIETNETATVEGNVAGVNGDTSSLKPDLALDSAGPQAELQDENNPKSLTLLGSSVEPGEAALLKWSLNAAFVENSTPVPVLVVNGVKPGPTLCLTAAVHGDELNGIEIVRRIVHEINPENLSGSVIGVPIVNMQGFRRASRYLPDRRDLNRSFPGRENGSYASRTAHSFFTNVIQHCSYLIDIHTGSLSRTNLPQIRANLLIPEIASLAEKMGSIVVLQSKGSVGTLRRAAMNAGIPAVTLEAGAPNNLQKEAVEEGVTSILSAMSSLNLIPKNFWKRNKEPVFYQSAWIRAHQGGILFSKVELGDSVEKGEVLGLLNDPVSNKSSEITAPFEGRVIGMALNQIMYPGFAAYHIGLRSSIVEAAQPQELIPDEAVEKTQSLNQKGQGVESRLPTSSESEGGTKPSEVEVEKQLIEDMELPTIENE